jgi:transposase
MKICVAVVMSCSRHLHSAGQLRKLFNLFIGRDAMKDSSAQKINWQLARSGHVWQTESFDRVLCASESLDAKVAYILDNPVRKALVKRWRTIRGSGAGAKKIHTRQDKSRSDSRLGCRPKRSDAQDLRSTLFHIFGQASLSPRTAEAAVPP